MYPHGCLKWLYYESFRVSVILYCNVINIVESLPLVVAIRPCVEPPSARIIHSEKSLKTTFKAGLKKKTKKKTKLLKNSRSVLQFFSQQDIL